MPENLERLLSDREWCDAYYFWKYGCPIAIKVLLWLLAPILIAPVAIFCWLFNRMAENAGFVFDTALKHWKPDEDLYTICGFVPSAYSSDGNPVD